VPILKKRNSRKKLLMYSIFKMENKLKQVIRKTAYLKEWLCIEQAVQYLFKFRQQGLRLNSLLQT